jgi:DNA-binding ferritin-like protein (Dps family)
MSTAYEEVQLALENLIRVASRHKAFVAGFAFSAEPFLISFGNCSDVHEIKLYERLVELCEEKRKKGQSVRHIVGEIN